MAKFVTNASSIFIKLVANGYKWNRLVAKDANVGTTYWPNIQMEPGYWVCKLSKSKFRLWQCFLNIRLTLRRTLTDEPQRSKSVETQFHGGNVWTWPATWAAPLINFLLNVVNVGFDALEVNLKNWLNLRAAQHRRPDKKANGQNQQPAYMLPLPLSFTNLLLIIF